MDFKKEDLVKSPFNYIGGKFKLLPQILPLFPDKISMFYDVFGGGGTLSLNVKSEYVYYNDIVTYVSNMFGDLQQETIDTSLNKIHEIINTFKLSKENIDGFNRLRDYYNKGNKSWDVFYMLVCHSFNYQYRFNNKHDYNSSFGKNRSCYSKTTEDKFIKFMERLNELDIVFGNNDFREIDFSDADENDLIYFDSPYLITCGNYNDGKRGFKGWSEKDDEDLMNLCDRLDIQGTRFAVSNVLADKGKENIKLKEWSKKYKVYYLNNTYGNCNYQTKDKRSDSTVEVLITNY